MMRLASWFAVCLRLAIMPLAASVMTCLVSIAPARSQGSPVAASPTPDHGTHFIVLLHDTGQMKPYQRLIATVLPSVLLGIGIPEQSPRLPAFRPGRDVLSFGAYGVSEASQNRPKQCSMNRDRTGIRDT